MGTLKPLAGGRKPPRESFYLSSGQGCVPSPARKVSAWPNFCGHTRRSPCRCTVQNVPRRPLARGEFPLLQKERQKFRERNSKTLFFLGAAMAEERFISTCDLSSYSSSFSISSPDSTASSAFSNNITDSGNSSWAFSPLPIPDGNGGPLFHMKFLRASLPSRKRGLSNYFTGKSQSFTSLANVKCVEDFAKPEKKLKSSHSWESVMKSSYNNKTIRSSILSAGSAESMEMPRKASFGRKMSKKNSGLIPCGPLLSPPKQMT